MALPTSQQQIVELVNALSRGEYCKLDAGRLMHAFNANVLGVERAFAEFKGLLDADRFDFRIFALGPPLSEPKITSGDTSTTVTELWLSDELIVTRIAD